MKILVQKFGGTSVASQEARIAVKDKVQKAVRSGFAPGCSCFCDGTQRRTLRYRYPDQGTEGNESFSQRARTGYDDVLRRDHGSLRYGSDAAEIRDQCYALTAVRPGLLRILSLVRHGSKISMSAICIIYWNQALFLLSAGFRA